MLENEIQLFQEYLEEQKGKMTYDEALSMWGKPSEIADGDEIFVATWEHNTFKSRSVATRSMGSSRSGDRGWILHITFDKETRKMTFYNFYNW